MNGTGGHSERGRGRVHAPVDALPAAPCGCRVACLHKVVVLNVVEDAVVVVLDLAELDEVERRLGRLVREEVDRERAQRRLHNHAHRKEEQGDEASEIRTGHGGDGGRAGGYRVMAPILARKCPNPCRAKICFCKRAARPYRASTDSTDGSLQDMTNICRTVESILQWRHSRTSTNEVRNHERTWGQWGL